MTDKASQAPIQQIKVSQRGQPKTHEQSMQPAATERQKLSLKKTADSHIESSPLTENKLPVEPDGLNPEPSQIQVEDQENPLSPVEPEPIQVIEPELAVRYCATNGVWHAQYEAVVGLAHRTANPPLPCQDAALALVQPRPLVLVADGAGSSPVSEIGSLAVVTGIARLINTLEQQVAALLDQPGKVDAEATHRFALMLVKHAKGLLDDLAVSHRRPQNDFRCTLLLALVGSHHVLWLKIGDGALVVEKICHQPADKAQALPSLSPELRTLGTVGKGEFANLTTFIDNHLRPEDVQIGTLVSNNISGLGVMSDGAADRLVAQDGSMVAAQVSQWLQTLREDKLNRRTLTQRLYSDTFTKGTTGDDCSLALLACGFSYDE